MSHPQLLKEILQEGKCFQPNQSIFMDASCGCRYPHKCMHTCLAPYCAALKSRMWRTLLFGSRYHCTARGACCNKPLPPDDCQGALAGSGAMIQSWDCPRGNGNATPFPRLVPRPAGFPWESREWAEMEYPWPVSLPLKA